MSNGVSTLGNQYLVFTARPESKKSTSSFNTTRERTQDIFERVKNFVRRNNIAEAYNILEGSSSSYVDEIRGHLDQLVCEQNGYESIILPDADSILNNFQEISVEPNGHCLMSSVRQATGISEEALIDNVVKLVSKSSSLNGQEKNETVANLLSGNWSNLQGDRYASFVIQSAEQLSGKRVYIHHKADRSWTTSALSKKVSSKEVMESSAEEAVYLFYNGSHYNAGKKTNDVTPLELRNAYKNRQIEAFQNKQVSLMSDLYASIADTQNYFERHINNPLLRQCESYRDVVRAYSSLSQYESMEKFHNDANHYAALSVQLKDEFLTISTQKKVEDDRESLTGGDCFTREERERQWGHLLEDVRPEYWGVGSSGPRFGLRTAKELGRKLGSDLVPKKSKDAIEDAEVVTYEALSEEQQRKVLTKGGLIQLNMITSVRNTGHAILVEFDRDNKELIVYNTGFGLNNHQQDNHTGEYATAMTIKMDRDVTQDDLTALNDMLEKQHEEHDTWDKFYHWAKSLGTQVQCHYKTEFQKPQKAGNCVTKCWDAYFQKKLSTVDYYRFKVEQMRNIKQEIDEERRKSRKTENFFWRLLLSKLSTSRVRQIRARKRLQSAAEKSEKGFNQSIRRSLAGVGYTFVSSPAA